METEKDGDQMNRWDIINGIITERNFGSFIEIGTRFGETFRQVHVPVKVSVDPDPRTDATFITTSDEYFREHGDKFDIVFIDGLHECRQAYRDVRNALEHLNSGGVIVMHDCHPTDEDMQEPYRGQYFWTGDVWKAFVKARAELDYEMYVVDHDFGCGIIDTSRKGRKPAGMPVDMEKMTFRDFAAHPEWMDFRERWE